MYCFQKPEKPRTVFPAPAQARQHHTGAPFLLRAATAEASS